MREIDYLNEQYELVRQCRQVLINYCQTISPSDFRKENTGFGRGGSIRNLLVHIANVYEFWIGKQALNKNLASTKYESIAAPDQLTELFESADNLMTEFINKIETDNLKKVDYEINGTKGSTRPLKLFTHVITHEFHHKGQILSLSRHLGYTPVDTDIIR